jgi:hypothetical protein
MRHIIVLLGAGVLVGIGQLASTKRRKYLFGNEIPVGG